jgi:hypothetical protein
MTAADRAVSILRAGLAKPAPVREIIRRGKPSKPARVKYAAAAQLACGKSSGGDGSTYWVTK